MGVSTYVVEHAHQGDSRRLKINLLNDVDVTTGTLVADWLDDGERFFELSVADAWIQVRWQPYVGHFELKDLRSGEVFSRSLSVGATEPRVLRALERYLPQARLISVTIEDYKASIGQERTEFIPGNPRRSPKGRQISPIFNQVPRCTGILVRGTGINTSRSYCCEDARQDANVKCWNDWCAGCCRMLECDAVCAIGDYFCSCGRTGISCGPPCPVE